MGESLDKMLRTLRQEGLLESTGSFTIDFDRALAQQQGCRLSDPSAFVLKLVQWAVASRASRIEVNCSRSAVSVTHDGTQPTSEELARLLTYTLSDSPEPVRELAVAVNTALGLPSRDVTVLCTGPGGGRLLRLFPGKPPALSGLPALDRTTQRFSRVVVQRSLRWHLLRPPEPALVLRRCAWAPAVLTVNGQSVRDGVRFGGLNLASRRGGGLKLCWRDPEAEVLLMREVTPEHHVLELRYYEMDPGQDSFWLPPTQASRLRDGSWGSPAASAAGLPQGYALALGLRAESGRLPPDSPARLTLVWRGVTLEQLELPSPLPGVVGVLTATGMQTDLSEFSVVRNARYEEALARVGQELEGLARWLSPGQDLPQSLARIVVLEAEGQARTDSWQIVKGEEFKLSFPGRRARTAPHPHLEHRFSHHEREYCLFVVRLARDELQSMDHRTDFWTYAMKRIQAQEGTQVKRAGTVTVPADRFGGKRWEQTGAVTLSGRRTVVKIVVDPPRQRLFVLQAQGAAGASLAPTDRDVVRFFKSLTLG